MLIQEGRRRSANARDDVGPPPVEYPPGSHRPTAAVVVVVVVVVVVLVRHDRGTIGGVLSLLAQLDEQAPPAAAAAGADRAVRVRHGGPGLAPLDGGLVDVLVEAVVVVVPANGGGGGGGGSVVRLVVVAPSFVHDDVVQPQRTVRCAAVMIPRGSGASC